ncbi:hypothetical protein BaRGS_00009939 [Batillaria attramentaria]|uniref:Neuroguidin n=1 Tax=Batillaria attramentaria TaxID=370345 RepID=A0ABD0LHM8_9CAEN
MNKIKSSGDDVLQVFNSLLDSDIMKASHSEGISFLNVKNHVLLQYMIDLVIIMMQKTGGHSIQKHPAILRLVENRTVLEKMRPIDQKLKYQVDKLVNIAKTGAADQSDPLRFKANLDSIASKAPKLAPVPYTEDETLEERTKQKVERLKRRALSSTMMAELRRDHMEEPEEIVESRDLHRVREDRQRKERTDYEETYFVRTSLTKKEMNKSKRVATMSSLDGLLKFDNLAHLADDTQVDEPLMKKRKVSKRLKGKGKGKGEMHFD